MDIKLDNQTKKPPNKFSLSFITFLGIFLFAIGVIASERLIPIIETSFGLKHMEAGTIISAALIGFTGAMLTGGILSDFIQRKYLILIGFFLLSIGAVIFGNSSSYLFLLIGNLLIGVSGGLLEGLLSLVIMDIFRDKRGMVLNLSQVFFGLGAGTSPFLVMAFSKWKYFYYIIASAGIISLVISLFQSFPDKLNDVDNDGKSEIKIWQIFTDKRFLFTVIAMFSYSCTEMGIASWISVLFTKYYHSSSFMPTLSLSSYWTAQLLGRLTIGMKVDKFESENLISTLFFISAFLLLSGLVIKIAFVSYIFFTLAGFSMAPIWPTILSDARNRFNDFPGTAFGIIAAAGSGASIIIAPLIGRLADLYSVRVGLFITVFTSLSGGGIYLILKSLVKGENGHK